MGSARYTFGDDVAAVERLALVASYYEPVSRAFLARDAPSQPSVAIDLGCGPGFSTQLIDQVCAPQRLIGVDASTEFVDVAQQRVPQATFVTHDVTKAPLPGAPAQLIYARLVLAHLPDPVAIARAWVRDLAPGGVVMIEDLEAIDAPAGPLRDYDDVSATIVRNGGGVMYAGGELASFGGTSAAVTAPAARAAAIYLFNVRRWMAETNPPAPIDELEDLEAGLAATANTDSPATVSWIVRQVTITS